MIWSPQTRKALDQVKDDSSSLFGLRARSSFCSSRTASTCTRSSALLSMIFDFDDEVLASNAYQRPMRSLFRRHLRQIEGGASTSTRVYDDSTCHKLERYMKLMGRFPSPDDFGVREVRMDEESETTRILVPIFGGQTSGLSTLLELLKSLSLQSRDPKSRALAKYTIRSNLISSMRYISQLVNLAGLRRSDFYFRAHTTRILDLKPSKQTNGYTWTSDICDSITILHSCIKSTLLAVDGESDGTNVYCVEQDYKTNMFLDPGIRRGQLLRVIPGSGQRDDGMVSFKDPC